MASRRKYDVFLSFGGNDVRKGFTGHLFAALRRGGINVFIDGDEPEYGGGTEGSLNGIKLSKLALVILSKEYAFSSWRLEELVQILRFKKSDDVWPIFYDVDPSDVEEIKGSFGLALVEHQKRFQEEIVEEWKDALQQVSYLKGLDLSRHLDGHETRNIDHIVEEITRRLSSKELHVAIHPIGVRSRARQVTALMAIGLEKVRIVGIYGMGGIGKSTIAKEVFNSLLNKFDSSCFLDNVREVFQTRGIAYLQRQLLTEILGTKHEKIDNVDRGLNLIIQASSKRKVLIVLDDVDRLDQIHKIIGNCDRLYPGSRVIITTRMKDFLESSESYLQYEVSGLAGSDSLKLLCLHAFGKTNPPKDYIDCAENIVHHGGGIPLALEVLGSSLCGQSVDVWNSRLEKLEVIANDDIHSKLKISYDCLGDVEQSIFLDIACFFIGFDMNYIMGILDGCDFCPIDGIKTLVKRCLVKIGFGNKLFMHELLRDMGRETVRQENAIDPGERSRLWHHEDVVDVLSDKMGTPQLEGLVLNIPGFKPSWSTKAFKKMKMLRLLQLNHTSLKGSYNYVSSKLRWLCWREFPLACIPSEFGMKNLVALDMRYSKLKQFSEEGKQSLKKLKFLNLNHSHELVETPDFEGCTKLEKLTFKDCISLEIVHENIGLLNHLVFLSFQDCKSLQYLPVSIGGLKMLEKFNLSGCLKLEDVPESIGCLTHLVSLNFENCESLVRIPGGIGNIKSLKDLNMSGCLKLEALPESFGFLTCLHLLDFHNCKSLKNLPGSIGDIKSLKELNLSGCLKLEVLPDSIGSLACLRSLDLHDCKSLKTLPGSIGALTSLEDLIMSGCAALEDLPDSAGCFTSLCLWDLQDCKNLKHFPEEILGLRALSELNMSGCSKLEELPESLGNLKSLVALNLDGTAISTLTENIQNLSELKTLSMRECHRVFLPKKYPHIINFLPFSLKELDISSCKLTDGMIPLDLQCLAQLVKVDLNGNDFTSLPDAFLSLPKLGSLSLNDCRWLQSIRKLQPSVESLHANNCPLLESIDLTNFRGDAVLELSGCLNLKEIEGYFNLEPLAIDVVEKLLKMNGSCIRNFYVRKIDNLTQTNRLCEPHTLSERGIYNIFIPGSESPTWLSHQREGDTVSLTLPSIDPGSEIIGIVTCATYAWKKSSDLCCFSPNICISNITKMYEWIYDPYVTFLSTEVDQDMTWLSYWMFSDLNTVTDELDVRRRFKNELEEGDEVEFSMDLGSGILVRNCGIQLLYQPTDSQPADLAMVPYATSRHHRKFLSSRPQFVSMERIKEETLLSFFDVSSNQEYRDWSERRNQRVTRWRNADHSSSDVDEYSSDEENYLEL